MKLVRLTDHKGYAEAAAKLAGIRLRIADLEHQLYDRPAVTDVPVAAESLSIDELLKPVAVKSADTGSKDVAAAEEISRLRIAEQRQLDIVAREKAAATRPVAIAAGQELARIAAAVDAKLKEARTIADKASGVLEDLRGAGYTTEMFEDDMLTFHDAHQIMRHVHDHAAAVAKVPSYVGVKVAALPDDAEEDTAYVQFLGSLAGHNFSYKPGDVVSGLPESDVSSLVERQIAKRISPVAAKIEEDLTGVVTRKHRPPAATIEEARPPAKSIGRRVLEAIGL
jgi:hypothetical protein